jgi:GxxExxY protein
MLELVRRGLRVDRQKHVPVLYKGTMLDAPLVLDMVVEDLVVVENKATTSYSELFQSQLLTYLRVSGLKLGLLVNFGEKRVADGIHRVVNSL